MRVLQHSQWKCSENVYVISSDSTVKRRQLSLWIVRVCQIVLVLAGLFLVSGCKAKNRLDGLSGFVTTNKDYYITRIGSVPKIDESTYSLSISGLVDTPMILFTR